MGMRSKNVQIVVATLLFGLATLVGWGFSGMATGFASTGGKVYVSSSSSGTVDGVAFTGGDILVYDSDADTWAMFFDASDVLPNSANTDGFHIVDPGPSGAEIQMGFTGIVNVPGLGSVDDSDLITFTGTTGPVTAGTFAWLADGSDVGLTSGGEDIDAVSIVGPDLAISTLGNGSVPLTGGGTVTVADEDVVTLSGTVGNPTTGTFDRFVDSSDAGFTGDLVSLFVDPASDAIFSSALNNYNIGGLSGDGDDIIVFTGTTGDPTSGTYELYWDGDQHRFGGEQIDGLFLEPGIPTPTGTADLEIEASTDVATAAVAGDTVTYTVTVTNNGPDQALNVVVTDTLPSGVTLTSTSGCALDPNGLPCSLGDVANGDDVSFTIAVTVDGDVLGQIDNTVQVVSGSSDPNSSDNAATASFLAAGPPTAVDDGPSSNSIPGGLFHTDTDVTFTAAAPGLLANDNLGSPIAQLAMFGGGDVGGGVTNNAGDTVALSDGGSLTVNGDGSVSFTPPAGFTGPFRFDYTAANPGGSSQATTTIYVGPRPVVMGGDLIYLSTAAAGTVDSIVFEDEDILVYNRTTDTWSMHFDGSDVGLGGSADIDGFAIQDDGTILFSLTAPRTIPGAGSTDDSDIVAFTPTSTGQNTAGSFSFHVDGSDLRLTAGGEDIDAITEYGAADLAISTFGSYNMGGGVAGLDEDLIALGLIGTGPVTNGNPSLLFDGSDVSLQSEDIYGASIDPETDIFYLANFGVFNIPNLTGDGDDVITFTGTVGSNTSGTFSTFFAGEDARFDNHQIDGLHVALGEAPTNTPPRIVNTTFDYSGAELELIDVEVEAEDDEDSPNNLTYSVGGPDADHFFPSDRNVFTLLPFVDFEYPVDANGDNIYELEVTVTDSGGLSDTKLFRVTIVDVEPEVIQLEAAIDGANVDTISEAATIADGGTVPLSLTLTTGSSVPSIEWIDLTLNGVNVPVDPATDCGLPQPLVDELLCQLSFPAADAPTGTVVVTQAVLEFSGMSLLQTTLTDEAWYRTNPPPEIDPASTSASVPENQSAATDVNATDDSDSEGSGLTYSLLPGEDAALLTIDPTTGVVTFNAAPDYENPQDGGLDNTYVATVRVEDSGGLTDDETITITVTNVVEQATLGDFLWHDVNEDGLQTPGEPGVEGADAVLTDPVTFTEIARDTTDENGAYSFTVDPGTYELSFENVPGNEAYTTPLAGTDPTIDSDFDQTSPFVTVTLADDQVNNTIDAGVTFPNSPPMLIVTGPYTMAENLTEVVDLNATDDSDSEAAGTLTYSIFGGIDAAFFSIDAQTGVLSFQTAPDYEDPQDDGTNNRYMLLVEVTDSENASATYAIDVDVTNVVEQATLGDRVWDDANGNGVQETGEPGVAGVTVNLVDGNSDPAGTTTTVSGGRYSFTVDPGQYTVTFVLPSGKEFTTQGAGPDPALDSDADPVDGSAGPITLADDEDNDTIDAGLIDANQAPVLTNDGNHNVPERQTGAVTVTATDDGPPGDLVYTIQLSGADESGLFSIDPVTGVVTFDTAPDYENPGDVNTGSNNTYLFNVRVTDAFGLFDEELYSITVTDVAEDPVITTTTSQSVDENSSIAIDVDATDDQDSETNGTLNYSLDPNNGDDDLLSIDSQTGVVTFLTPPDYENPIDFGANNSYTFLVRVEDSEGNFGEQVFSITIDNVIESGSISDRVWTDTNENGIQDTGESGRDGVTVNLRDPDDEDDLITSVTTSGGGLYSFTVNPGNYTVEFVTPADTVFTTQGAGTDPALDSDADQTTGRTAIISISDDEDNDTIDAGLVEVPADGLYWARQFAGSGPISASLAADVAVDAAGNNYTVGYFYGTVDFDPDPATTFPLTSAGNSDAYVTKLDTAGNLQWARRLGGTNVDGGWTVAIDGTGNVYVAGFFRGTADFDPDPATTFNLTSTSTAFDAFVVKLNTDGDLVWAKNFGGTADDYGYGITVDSAGNAFVAGIFRNTADFDPDPATSFNLTSNGNLDAYLLKLNADGSFGWAQQIGGTSYDETNGVAVDAAGNVYVTGYFGATVDLDPDPVGVLNFTVQGGSDSFVTKRAPNGALLWAKQLGGPSSVTARDLTIDTAGNVFAAGSFSASADFDPDPGTTANRSSNGGSDAFVTKLDTSGNLVWASTMGGPHNEETRAVAIDSAGNVVISGDFRGTADFDPHPSTTFNLVGTDQIIPDAYVAKLRANGDFDTAKQLVGVSYNRGYGVGMDGADRTYAVGGFRGTVDFGPNPHVPGLLTLGGGEDSYLLKLDLDGGNEAPTIGTGSLEITEGDTFVDDLVGNDDNDSEGSGLTYAIEPGGDGALFDIDANTGALSFLVAPDFEIPGDGDNSNDYELTVSLTDSGNRGVVEALTVTVLDDPSDNNPPVVGTDDGYDSLGNVGITVDAANGVLDNDTGGLAPLTVTEVAGAAGNVGSATATTQGGSVTVAADGGFDYTPAPGFEGTDTFTYTVGDAAADSDTATVTITVNEVIWFIDASAAAGGDGTLDAPFDATGDLNTVSDEAGDVIYLASGNYSERILLLAGQQLIGSGSTADIPTATGIAVPTHSKTLPMPTGTIAARPTLTVSGTSPLPIAGAGARVRGVSVASPTSSPVISSSQPFEATELTVTPPEGGTGIQVSFSGATQGTVSITDSEFNTTPATFTNGGATRAFTSGTAQMHLEFTGNSVTAGPTRNMGAVAINSADSSKVTADISNNPRLQARGTTAIRIDARNNSDIDLRVANNSDIRVLSTSSTPVTLLSWDTASLTAEVTNNTINPFSGNGIDAIANISTGASDLDVTLDGNTVNMGPSSTRAIALSSNFDATFCGHVLNNSVVSGGQPFDYALTVGESGTNDIVLQGLTSTVTGNIGTFAVGALDQVWDDNNNTETTNEEGYLSASIGAAAVPTAVPGTCDVPSIP